jgi:hypothetical protein
MCLRVGEHLHVRETCETRMEKMKQWKASWIALFGVEGTKDGARSTRVRQGDNLRDLAVEVWITSY